MDVRFPATGFVDVGDGEGGEDGDGDGLRDCRFSVE